MVRDGLRYFFYNQLKYLTYWGLLCTLIYFAYAITLNNSIGVFSGKYSKFNFLVLALNIDITVFFYLFLFEVESFDLSFYLTITNHIFPLILTLTEYMLNNSVFYFHNLWLALLVVCTYIPINAIITTNSETPIYDVLTYKDGYTVLYIIGNIFEVAMVTGF